MGVVMTDKQFKFCIKFLMQLAVLWIWSIAINFHKNTFLLGLSIMCFLHICWLLIEIIEKIDGGRDDSSR